MRRAGLVITYIGTFLSLVVLVPLLRTGYFMLRGIETEQLVPMAVVLPLLVVANLCVVTGTLLLARSRSPR